MLEIQLPVCIPVNSWSDEH